MTKRASDGVCVLKTKRERNCFRLHTRKRDHTVWRSLCWEATLWIKVIGRKTYICYGQHFTAVNYLMTIVASGWENVFNLKKRTIFVSSRFRHWHASESLGIDGQLDCPIRRAGELCGANQRKDRRSTVHKEKISRLPVVVYVNWC